MKISSTILLFILLFLFLNSTAQNYLNAPDSIADIFKGFIDKGKKEKIILETDRKIYGAGEKIWFRAFVVNDANDKIDLSSKNLFTDIVDDHDKVITKLVLNNSQLNTNGALSLPDTLMSGYYWLRSYTSKMLAEDIQSIFLQPVYVFNKERPDTSRYNRSATMVTNYSDHPRIRFFGERLTTIQGLSSIGVLQIVDANNNPVITSGDIVDNKDSTITSFTTNRFGLAGIGFLNKESQYTAIVHFQGKDTRFPLPSIDHYAAELSLINQTDTVARVFVSLADSLSSNYRTTIIGIAKGNICYAASGAGSYVTDIPLQNFSGGIASLMLFDEQRHFLGERKIYIKKENYHVDIKTNKKNYAARDKANVNIKVTDADEDPLAAILNISVQDQSVADLSDNVETDNVPLSNEFLLNNWLMLHEDKISTRDIDLLMMSLKSSDESTLNTAKENNDDNNDKLIYLLGKVTDKKKKPLKDRIVTVFSLTENSFFADADTTDESGTFKIPLPQNIDSLSLSLQETDKHGFPNYEDEIVTDGFIYPSVSTPAVLKNVFVLNNTNILRSAKKSNANALFGIDSKGVLKPVTVTVIKKKDPNYDVARRSSLFSEIVTNDKFKYSGPDAIIDALLMVAGVSLRGDQISIFGGGPPLIIMDGAEIPPKVYGTITEFLNSLQPSDIDFIEVMRGGEAATYGVRGGNGVIIINSKRGSSTLPDENKNVKAYTPVMYHVCPQFSMPDYSVKEIKNRNTPDQRNTIYWNGDIRTNVKGQASINFYTADNATNYSITITGLTAKGDIIYKRITVSRN